MSLSDVLGSLKCAAVKLSIFIVVEGVSSCPLGANNMRVDLVSVNLEATSQFAFCFVLFASLDSSVVLLVDFGEGLPLLLSSVLLFLLEKGVEADLETTGIWGFLLRSGD